MKEKEKQDVKKIIDLAENIVKQIYANQNPHYEIIQRSLSNVIFDEKNKILIFGNKKQTRSYFNINQAKKFMQSLLIVAKSKEVIENSKTVTIRELYYQLKGSGKKENNFDNQKESDPIIVDIETAIGLIREEMHIKADDKGKLIGNIVIKSEKDIIDASKLGRIGLPIPSIVEDLEIKKIDAKYVLVIETSGMWDRLVEEKYHQKNNCILIATMGQVSRGVRRMIYKLVNEYKIPVYAFTDGDPWGYYIYSVIKCGSIALAHESRRLATPSIKYIGMTMTDVEKYNLKKVTEPLKEVDVKRIDELLKYPWFKNSQWEKQLILMKETGRRIEQQALASKSLGFVAEKYLPEKIKNQDFLP
ncbi:MAG: DNA topoisomerase VI [Candidatus Aenigmarchaeota archaeon ex4484_52]|nr:MAG: DNA topoisomerase VI [Candidatus Aenigmarchaeota archaeon ex4484_52]